MSAASADQTGRHAERLAALYLRAKGYQILANRFATPVGEIDIVARRHDLVIFVEVKVRQSKARAMEAVSHHQQSRVTRAADAFLKNNPHLAQSDTRFDVIAFARWSWPTHIEDAWRAQHF